MGTTMPFTSEFIYLQEIVGFIGSFVGNMWSPVANCRSLLSPILKFARPHEEAGTNSVAGGFCSLSTYFLLAIYLAFYVASHLNASFPTVTSIVVFPQKTSKDKIYLPPVTCLAEGGCWYKPTKSGGPDRRKRMRRLNVDPPPENGDGGSPPNPPNNDGGPNDNNNPPDNGDGGSPPNPNPPNNDGGPNDNNNPPENGDGNAVDASGEMRRQAKSSVASNERTPYC